MSAFVFDIISDPTCFYGYHRGPLQRDPSFLWLRPGGQRGQPEPPRPPALRHLPLPVTAPPLQKPQQPRNTLLRLSGVHSLGNVTGSTATTSLCVCVFLFLCPCPFTDCPTSATAVPHFPSPGVHSPSPSTSVSCASPTPPHSALSPLVVVSTYLPLDPPSYLIE